MSQKDLLDAYKSIYTNDSLTEETRTMDKASRDAAGKRLDALKKDPKQNSYAGGGLVKSTEKPLKFGKYTDAWSHDPRADADFEKVHKREPVVHAHNEPKPNMAHKGKFGRFVDNAVKSLTREEVEQLTSYLMDEGYALCEDTAQVMCAHMSNEWAEFALNEMRKEDKVAGKKSGGDSNPAFREVKKMIRGMEGTPAGQQKKVPGKKPPRAGDRGGPMSPKTKVDINRARRQEGERNMSSRFD